MAELVLLHLFLRLETVNDIFSIVTLQGDAAEDRPPSVYV